MKDLLRVTIGDGKYTIVQDHNGELKALRHNEEWRDLIGDNLILTMAQEIEKLRIAAMNQLSFSPQSNTIGNAKSDQSIATIIAEGEYLGDRVFILVELDDGRCVVEHRDEIKLIPSDHMKRWISISSTGFSGHSLLKPTEQEHLNEHVENLMTNLESPTPSVVGTGFNELLMDRMADLDTTVIKENDEYFVKSDTITISVEKERIRVVFSNNGVDTCITERDHFKDGDTLVLHGLDCRVKLNFK